MTGVAETDASVAAEEKFFATGGADVPADTGAEAVVDTSDVEGAAPVKEEAKPDARAEEKPRMVPHGALHEERERRKQAEKRAERIEELFQRYQAERGQPKADDKGPELPAFDQDPANHLRLKQETAEQRLARLEAERHAEQQMSALRQQVTAHEAAFSAANPDYTEAVAYLRQLKVAQYEASGMTEAEAMQAAQGEALQFVHATMQRGLNPAQQAYALAKRWGYSPKSAEKPKSEEKLETIRKGQEAAKGGGGGASPEAPASLKSLADMDPTDPNFDKEWDRLMRRR